MPSLENLRINPTGEKSFVYPAADNPPALAAPDGGNPRIADFVVTTSDIIEALGFAPAPLDSPALTGAPTAPTPGVTDNSTAVATTAFVLKVVSAITGGTVVVGGTPAIRTVFGRIGDILLQASDVTGALGFSPASLSSPVFTGTPTAPTVVTTDSSGKLATTAFVQNLFSSASGTLRTASVGAGLTLSGNVLSANVTAVFGRTGAVALSAGDITGALSFTPAALTSPHFLGQPTAPTPTSTDNSTTLATTAFVQGLVASTTHNVNIQQIGSGLTLNSGVLTSDLTSVFGRTGAVVLTGADVRTALAYTPASTQSPNLLGNPTAPTPLSGDTSGSVATTAFVAQAIATINLIQFVGSGLSLTSGTLTARITSVFGRTGAITLTAVDVTTALAYTPASLASPSFTGTPTAPNPFATDNSTKLATTSFVQAAIQGGSQSVSVQATGGLVNTALTTRFGRTLSLVDDFGAAGDGFTDDTSAVTGWIAAVLASGAIGVAPTGTYSVSTPLVIDWTSVASRGAMFVGTGSSQCVISCTSSASSPAFLLTNSISQTSSYGKILGIGFTGSLPGVVLQIGKSDYSTPFSNFALDIAVTNNDPSTAACCLAAHGLADSTVTILASCGGHGSAVKITQASNCTFAGRLKQADTGLYLTGGNITSNVFQAVDISAVNTGVKIDSASVKSNTFIGGQINWDSGSGAPVAAINATAGANNRFINVFFPSLGPIVTGNAGISIDGSPYGALTTGAMTVVPVSGSPSTLRVLAVNSDSLVSSQADIGNAAMLIGTNAGQASLSLDCGGFGNATILFSKFTSNRWQLAATTTSEVGSSAGTDLVISRYANDGGLVDTPLAIGQSTGTTTLSSLSVVGAATFSSIVSTALAASPSYSTDAAAETAGIPLGGFYRNGNVVQIRITSATFSGQVTESLAAVDSVATLIITASVTETLAGADAPALLPLFATIATTGNLADAVTASNRLSASNAETGAVADAVSHL